MSEQVYSHLLYDVARTARPYLPQVVGDAADSYDAAIVGLLARASQGEDVVDEMLALMASEPRLRDWAAKVAGDDDRRPPELQSTMGGDPVLSQGVGRPVAAGKFVCPIDGAFAKWRRTVAERVPPCPDHGVRLVPE
ncbi:hypothetical protein [Cellulomonas sp. Leaf334]|uniref:hypothetical protein n=1 Tax=Cellulomonas sp. Leaf334 TaxID=1736339 RepID=UPI0006F9FB03|nr:hypothetical protein [Cellulomonas sp. Leaf334]KQR10405.1 hypothetical protein ASF78_17100 [Cellulomonas sp. Leaf334]